MTMPARAYELWMTDDYGLRLADNNGRSLLSTALWFRFWRVANGLGGFEMGLPKSFNPSFLTPDKGIQIWRAPKGGALSLWRSYLLRWWRFETADGLEMLTVKGPDVNDLLRRRIVVGYGGSSYTSKSDFADDMMKELVSESILDTPTPIPAAGTRIWADLSVAADLGDGPSINESFTPFNSQLLTPSGGGALAQVARASREAGVEVFFDVVPDVVSGSAITYEFRTNTGQPGQDLTSLGVLFDQERGNMKNPFLEYDYFNEANYVYGAGQGKGGARNVQQVSDSARYTASQWARCEAGADARNCSTDNCVREKARKIMEEGRPKRRFGAWPQDTVDSRFGIDWSFGDKVRARYSGIEFDAIVKSVVISVDRFGQEIIQARLDYED